MIWGECFVMDNVVITHPSTSNMLHSTLRSQIQVKLALHRVVS